MAFTGTGMAGDSVFVVRTGPLVLLASGIVGANGTFAVSASVSLANGQVIEARAGSTTGPTQNSVTVGPAVGAAAPILVTVGGGATVIAVSGAPGSLIIISADPDGPGGADPIVYGSAIIPPSGNVGVQLTQPLPPGLPAVDIIVNGVVDASFGTGAAGSPPVVSLGNPLEEGATLQGTGVPGATVQAVDSNGNILGSAVVDGAGNFLLPVAPAPAGTQIFVVQNGVKLTPALTSFKLGPVTAFTNKNVVKPEEGDKLSINFKASADERVTVKIFNMAGDLVRPVAVMDVRAGVIYGAEWDGRNGDGTYVASGVYVVSIRGPITRSLRKVVILR